MATNVTSAVGDVYNSALKRYADQGKQVLSKLTEAETGYGSLVSTYAPGGTYGAGQKAIVQKNAAQALAQSQIGAVQTGMSSSTNAAGMAARIKRDTSQQELGIEDTRSDKYAAVVQGLAALKAGSAGTMAGMAANEPYYAPYASTLANIYGTDVSAATARYGANVGASAQLQATNINAQTQMNTANLASQTQLAIANMNDQTKQAQLGGGGTSRNQYI